MCQLHAHPYKLTMLVPPAPLLQVSATHLSTIWAHTCWGQPFRALSVAAGDLHGKDYATEADVPLVQPLADSMVNKKSLYGFHVQGMPLAQNPVRGSSTHTCRRLLPACVRCNDLACVTRQPLRQRRRTYVVYMHTLQIVREVLALRVDPRNNRLMLVMLTPWVRAEKEKMLLHRMGRVLMRL